MFVFEDGHSQRVAEVVLIHDVLTSAEGDGKENSI